MNGLKLAGGATACVTILLGTLAAQDQSPLRVDTGRAGALPPGEVTEPVQASVELTRDSRRFLDGSAETSARLARQSESAFQRGLMPLTDYLNQLVLVEYVDVRVADLTATGRSDVYRRQVERLEDAWRRVAYRAPGVPGWRSDALLAELAVTEARLKAAETRGDAGAAAALKVDAEVLAAAQFEQRQADYRAAFATLPMMADSAQLSVDAALARDPGSQTAAALEADRRNYLESALSQTESWSSIDAGIGRADRVAAARLDVETGDPALNPEDVNGISREFGELFDTQREYYQVGTASLYDLARTWVAWHDVHQDVSADAVEETEAVRRGEALRELKSLAENVNDLRGRHAADVTYVQLAGQLDGLDALYSETEPRRDYLP